MKIENTIRVIPLANGKDARLVVETFVDGNSIGSHTALSGPRVDIAAYAAGEITWEEIEARWHKTKK
jgi:hypothetical protein